MLQFAQRRFQGAVFIVLRRLDGHSNVRTTRWCLLNYVLICDQRIRISKIVKSCRIDRSGRGNFACLSIVCWHRLARHRHATVLAYISQKIHIDVILFIRDSKEGLTESLRTETRDGDAEGKKDGMSWLIRCALFCKAIRRLRSILSCCSDVKVFKLF